MTTNRASHGRHGAAGGNATRWWTLAALTLAVGAIAIIWFANRKQYPEVTSPESLTLVRALYTACSSQNPARLAQVEQLLEQHCRDSKVSPAEERAFRAVIAEAKANRWEEARAASYRFAQDQVR